ncbi:hypothetical protein K450DRAFT_238803 [Umbelopsis ramanniana AG]|uniref:Protein Zds1 C-terminal domain-containing protein n=1 Tax=Umbelopsis ramanniana AG TaxID=1314678 RepID=A0AAD5EDG6_UMBRA|nr:uncharacterized protein K450DRAFT_238803 [Umbelopsis ramanniana AG]KAI8580240.1 hypothetical protein K450DRAFT_238803 [Umbelopsis ramanniana AG]
MMGSVNVQPLSLNLSNVVEKDPNVPSPPPTPTNGLMRNLSVTSLRRTNSTERKEQTGDVINIETPNPSHLYWVPAEQHPEIAPAEFNYWLEEHAFNSDRRPRIRRRRSVLSVSYTPDDIEAEEEPMGDDDQSKDDQAKDSVETTLAILESRSETHEDNSVLDHEEEEEEEEVDTSRKDRIRRSLSLNLPIISEQSDHINVFDRNSSPFDASRVLVPKADSSLLRRGARTKIRRNSTMDSISASSHDEPNAGRPTRKRSRNASAGTGSDVSRIGMVPPGGISLQDAPVIFIEDEPIQEEPTNIIISPPQNNNTNRVAGPRTSSLPSASMRDMLADKLKADSQPVVDATPSNIPIAADTPSTNELTLPKAPSPSPSTSTGRKSTWSRLFLRAADDSNKTKRNTVTKSEVVEERPLSVPETLSPSSTRSTSPAPSESLASASGRKFGSLSSLFSRASVRPAGSKTDTNSNKVASATKVASKKVPPLPKRLPIHVERAIYRLSHMKLANPRRPLQHQVLISNFMFWYLSIVDASKANNSNGEMVTAAAAAAVSPELDGFDKKGKKINKFVAAGKKRRQEIIQNKQRKVALAHERMGGRRSETVIPAVQYDKQVLRHHPLPHVGPRGPLMTPQQYIGTASAPTGFVVPQQYLHPATKPSSEGESDGEDDEEDDEDDDEDDNVQWPLPPKAPSHTPPLDLHPAHLGSFGMDMIKLDDEEDDVPLALYRKSH